MLIFQFIVDFFLRNNFNEVTSTGNRVKLDYRKLNIIFITLVIICYNITLVN